MTSELLQHHWYVELWHLICISDLTETAEKSKSSIWEIRWERTGNENKMGRSWCIWKEPNTALDPGMADVRQVLLSTTWELGKGNRHNGKLVMVVWNTDCRTRQQHLSVIGMLDNMVQQLSFVSSTPEWQGRCSTFYFTAQHLWIPVQRIEQLLRHCCSLVYNSHPVCLTSHPSLVKHWNGLTTEEV